MDIFEQMIPCSVSVKEQQEMGFFCPERSALSVPAPDGGVVAHCDQDAAVAAEAGLSDGRRAFRNCQCGAPEEKTKVKRMRSLF